jgi:hypothetical protein
MANVIGGQSPWGSRPILSWSLVLAGGGTKT